MTEAKRAYYRAYRAKNHQKLIDYHIDWWIKNGDEINRRIRKRRATDQEFRERERQRWRDYAARKRAENPNWHRPVKDSPGRPKGESK